LNLDSSEATAFGLSLVIPTYCRGTVLLATITALLDIMRDQDELLLIDQTKDHPPEVTLKLTEADRRGDVRWLRREQPSIPAAMNAGLLAARNPVVLFLDDDILPDAHLVDAHRDAQAEADLVAGMVLQPGQVAQRLAAGAAFRFNSDAATFIDEFMGGNFSIKRDLALALGGFDENFVGAAYRFEAEFAHRYVARHGQIAYRPSACIHHLQIPSGGTRAVGHHLTTAAPSHSVGAYYFWLRTRQPGWRLQFLLRPLRAVRTRYHLRHCWRIPVTLLAEVRGMLLARRLSAQGPCLLDASASKFDVSQPSSLHLQASNQ